MIDGIIFDLDGTLWDSTAVCAKAWNHAVEKATGKNPGFTAATLKAQFGKLVPVIAANLFPEESTKRQLELMDLCVEEEHRQLRLTPGALYPGLEDTLKTLQEKYPLFIVSNSQAGYIELFLEDFDFHHYFKDHLCAGDTNLPKNENITIIKEKHHLEACVYVGDTNGDHDASLKSGTPFIHAAYGFEKVANPDGVIKSFSDLLTVVENF
ncbi:HAD family hydrolase [Lachnospiraceae bacterium OttesenSCG-928-J05]|nr:HAD family hydrolase [Lachnospiraceae bacterium OttesenSCG-928-J05]